MCQAAVRHCLVFPGLLLPAWGWWYCHPTSISLMGKPKNGEVKQPMRTQLSGGRAGMLPSRYYYQLHRTVEETKTERSTDLSNLVQPMAGRRRTKLGRWCQSPGTEWPEVHAGNSKSFHFSAGAGEKEMQRHLLIYSFNEHESYTGQPSLVLLSGASV